MFWRKAHVTEAMAWKQNKSILWKSGRFSLRIRKENKNHNVIHIFIYFHRWNIPQKGQGHAKATAIEHLFPFLPHCVLRWKTVKQWTVYFFLSFGRIKCTIFKNCSDIDILVWIKLGFFQVLLPYRLSFNPSFETYSYALSASVPRKKKVKVRSIS